MRGKPIHGPEISSVTRPAEPVATRATRGEAATQIRAAGGPDTGGFDSDAARQAYALFVLRVTGALPLSRADVAAGLQWSLALRRGLALRGMPRRHAVFYRPDRPCAAARGRVSSSESAGCVDTVAGG